MADWFETRFREPVDAGLLDPAFAARMRALVVEEWQADAGSTASDDTRADDHEGDIIMLEAEDHTTTGNEPASPRHRSPGRWLLVAAVVVLVGVVGAVLAASGDNDDERKIDTATSVPQDGGAMNVADAPEGELEPGMYFVDPDGDPSTGLRVTYEIADDGWARWGGASKMTNGPRVMLTITTVTNVVTDACGDHSPADPAIGPTADDLATALSELAPFEVTPGPDWVSSLGRQGRHLELTVPDPDAVSAERAGFTECQNAELHSWIAPFLGGAFHGYNGPEPGLTEEFLIFDVNDPDIAFEDRTRLVIITTTSPDAPAEWLAERDAIIESIKIGDRLSIKERRELSR